MTLDKDQKPKTRAVKSVAKPPPQKRTCVMVLGMHRSGTSMMAGILGRLGATNPEHPTPADGSNERGYYESTPIVMLNDHILGTAGSEWSDWQPVNPGWFTSTLVEDVQERARALIQQEFGTSRLFVMKDPRMCRLMPFWRDVFAAENIDLRVLHIHRNPLDVAASLQKRDGMSPDLSYLIWLRHVLEAEAQTRDLPRYFTSYQAVLENWSSEVEAAAQALSLSWPRMSAKVQAQVQEFLSPDLMHFQAGQNQLLQNPLMPSWLRDSYDILERWCRGAAAPEDTGRLDEIRTQLNQSVPGFARLMEEGRATAVDLQKTKAALGVVRKQATEHKGARETAESELEAKTAALAEEKAKSKAAEQAHQQALDQARAQIAQLQEALDNATRDLAQRHAESDYWSRQAADLREAQERHQAEDGQWKERVVKLGEDLAQLTKARQAEAERSEAAQKLAVETQERAKLRAKNADQHQELARVRAEMERLHHEKAQLMRSTSWRITAPLRAVFRLLGRG